MCGVRIYNRALQQSEMKTIYNTLGPCDGPKPAYKGNFQDGLVYHMPMNEGKGTTTKVVGGVSSTGILENGAAWEVTSEYKAVKLNGHKAFVKAPGLKAKLHSMTACGIPQP